MTDEIDLTRARAARIAVSVLFFANGAIAASVLPRLPAIKDSARPHELRARRRPRGAVRSAAC